MENKKDNKVKTASGKNRVEITPTKAADVKSAKARKKIDFQSSMEQSDF